MKKFNGIYIRNVEAVDAFKMVKGEREKLKCDWTGFVPYSLELLKLQKENMEIIKKGKNVKIKDDDLCCGKTIKSLDLINLNFNCGYFNVDAELAKLDILEDNKANTNKRLNLLKIKDLQARIDMLKADNNEDNKIEIEELITEIKTLNKKFAKTLNADLIREELYQNGFCDENGIKFVLYKRSGSKSRQGKVMFIREELACNMLNWGRMDLNFPCDKEIDVVGIGAYSSLVSSKIEDTIHIDGKGILIIEDIKSSWEQDCKIVKKGMEHLEVEEGVTTLESCLTDGSSILDKGYFEEGQDFKLLRNHMFKSCAFKGDIQLFYMDYCQEHGLNYDTFKVKDMFGNKMLAKDVKLIITPNSLKVLKFKKDLNLEPKELYKLWKKVIKRDKHMFGICKHNYSSKWQFEGLEYQQMSYQMVNSLPLSKEELKDVCKWEIEYIDKLKNDIHVFKDYLIKTENDMNCNAAMVGILDRNKDFEYTNVFRDFRKYAVNRYVEKLKSGKIKNIGDYCTIVANPLEYLKATVGAYKEEDLSIVGDNIFTKLFPDGEELICFRNPHTSQANVLVAKNVYNEKIERYFNFGRNIVIVNCINNAICQILSGADFDSDSMLIFDNETLVEAGKRCYGEYKICENGIERDGNKYALNNLEMASIDNKLSKSKGDIGQVVNLGQLAMSKYWNLKNNGATEQELKEIQKIIDVMTILSGVAIDNAKKQYVIDIEEEIRYIRKKLDITKKPLFWKFVSEDKRLKCEDFRKENLMQYHTPMDLLTEVLSENVARAIPKNNVELRSLLVDLPKEKANRKQESEIIEQIRNLTKITNSCFENMSDDNKEEKYIKLNQETEKIEESLNKLTIKKETMADLIYLIAGEGQEKKIRAVREIETKIISKLFKQNSNYFLSIFNENH